MESDDLMAALFPDAAACQENITGPIEIPDHPLVRQTVHDTLTEGLDIDGLTDLLDGIETGRVRVHFRDTTEASAFGHEILTAKPYAFLDDGEAVDRRTNAVSLRRGLPVELGAIGRLDPEAVARVEDEVAPAPRSPDELHDLLGTLVVTPAREDWRLLFEKLAERKRVRSHDTGEVELWWTAEADDQAAVVVHGAPDDVHPREAVAAAVLRGHLDISGPRTPAALARLTGMSGGQVTVGLAVLENEGFVLQGAFSDPDRAREPDDVEWCARRLLARMHAYSRRARRKAVEPASAPDFVRFLLRWHHVAPGTQVRGHSGVRAVVEQLQGFEAAVAAWEPEILARRVADYRPGQLDRLCHDGEVTWLRLRPPEADGDRKAGPSKATPVALAFRADMPWLLQAARSGGEPAVPEVGATAEVVEALEAKGARFLSELMADTGRLATDLEQALWDGVARGLLTADGFAAIRALVEGPRKPAGPARSLTRRRLGAQRPTTAAGRWSLVGEAEAVEDREGLAEVVADQLLARWGVVFRDLAVHDGVTVPWRDLQWALRRFEDRGLVRGGRFVTGFSGEQYALPAAMDALKAARKAARDGEPVTVNACDPLNLTGVIIRGPRTPAVRTNTVTYVDGLPA
jgi:ATP-dependent Lhr-like helicase